jgi:hypothetical protein
LDPRESKLFAVGLSKGSVIFVSMKNMSMIYTRISYHRERILGLDGLRQRSETRASVLLSLCVEGYVKLVVFGQGSAECIHTYNCNKWLSRAITFRICESLV